MNTTDDGDLSLLLAEIKQLEFSAKAQIHDLHVIMNYLIKQLDIFDKLNEKYPNVLTFKTAISESQEVVEKIILIQEQNQKCLQNIGSVFSIVDSQNEYCKTLKRKLDVIKIISEHLNGVFEVEQSETKDELSEFKDVMKSLNDKI
ncbi:MAG: hypothetical protein E7K04_02980 [Helicobacter sp.]|nr:hypothetical protein [Helicobacter sp.]